jgi:hypothetical protein
MKFLEERELELKDIIKVSSQIKDITTSMKTEIEEHGEKLGRYLIYFLYF